MFAAAKVVIQALVVSGAVGATAVTMFGADSATTPRRVVDAPAAAASSTTTTTAASTAAPPTEEYVDPAGAGGYDGAGTFGDTGGEGADPGAGGGPAPTAAGTPVTTASVTGTVPPPTVDESGVPLALPVSAAVLVGGAAGGVAFARRRSRLRDGGR